MAQRYHDGMAAVQKKGKPSFFVTMTCNPRWHEIKRELEPGEAAHDRPDLCARVFKMKLDALLAELFKDGIFGRVIAHLHVIEFQKRGLPHAHILVILATEHRLKTVDDIDACVSAELPVPPEADDYETEEEYDAAYARYEQLASLVVKHVTHQECGALNPHASCMEGCFCKANFPKAFAAATTYSDSQIYPIYRRRAPDAGGASYTTDGGRVIDNSWITPYSPYLMLKYECHLNVEVCFSVESVKYLYKYVYKGPDRAMVATLASGEDVNEIQLFQDLRSFGASEGCWRTFDFKMYDRAPPVVRLNVHLEDHQTCTYVAGTEAEVVAEGPPTTQLTAWLDHLKSHPEDGRPLPATAVQVAWSAKYPDFCERFKYDKKAKEWRRRKQIKGLGYIGRVYTKHPRAGEVYYLRKLLHRVPGCDLALPDDAAPADESVEAATQRHADRYGFDALKYHAGVKLDTYKDVCAARGLLQDDAEWHAVLEEACGVAMPRQIRDLFVWIVRFNSPLEPLALFDAFYRRMGDDLARALAAAGQPTDVASVRLRVLLEVAERLESSGECLQDKGIPFSDDERAQAEALAATVARRNEPREILDELPENTQELADLAAANYAKLLPSQRALVDSACDAADNSHALAIFVDAPGGTGKTFCFNTILAHVRSQGGIALATASSGIAAILLMLGRTLHSRAKVPRKPEEDQPLNITAQSDTATLFRRASVIIIDEAPMLHRFIVEALDITLRDLMQSDEPFGGKVVVCGGDFRQTLPVVPRASHQQILDACLTRSRLWQHFQQHRLIENMRVRMAASEGHEDAGELQAFAEWLLRLGNGTEPHDELDAIDLPEDLCQPEGADVEALLAWVYPDLATNCTDPDWLAARAILTPLNATVDAINAQVTEAFPGEAIELLSSDVASETDAIAVTEELLNTLHVPNFPSHELRLKPRMPLMLLRNISPSDGLCNGTRLIFHSVIGRTGGRQLLECEIASGSKEHIGDIVYIPRLTLGADDEAFPFKWSRRQFPVRRARVARRPAIRAYPLAASQVRPAFAMTVNKAQGQTLKRVGVYLPDSCFTHGQLYVAASRVGLPAHLRFAVPWDEETGSFRTRNIVFRDALTS